MDTSWRSEQSQRGAQESDAKLALVPLNFFFIEVNPL